MIKLSPKSIKRMLSVSMLMQVSKNLLNQNEVVVKFLGINFRITRASMLNFHDHYVFNLPETNQIHFKYADTVDCEYTKLVMREDVNRVLGSMNPLVWQGIDGLMSLPKFRDGFYMEWDQNVYFVSRYAWHDFKTEVLYPCTKGLGNPFWQKVEFVRLILTNWKNLF